MKTIETTITIDRPTDEVWAALTDLASYADWNPFIVEAAGAVEPGARLTLRMQPVGGKAMTVRPTVVDAEPGRRLRWRGRLGVPGLLDAEHTFALVARADGGTDLVQHEEFRGILLPLVARSLDRGTLPAFGLMDRALKARVERCPRPESNWRPFA